MKNLDNMDENLLNSVLRRQARSLGLCDKWYDEWERHATSQVLIEKYLKGIDFCIKHDYPSLDFIKDNFKKEELMANGIFVDEAVDAENVSTTVVMGQSKGVLRYDRQSSFSVYVRHESAVTITANRGARVFVETYENCKVSVEADSHSKVFVYRHGGEVSAAGNVVVRDKRT